MNQVVAAIARKTTTMNPTALAITASTELERSTLPPLGVGSSVSGEVAEPFDLVADPGDDEQVTGLDDGLGGGMGEPLTGSLHADDGDAVGGAWS